MSITDEISVKLKSHELRATPNRIEVLRVFFDNEYAISHGFLLDQLSEGFDRVTLYRTLKNFEDAGLIHTVLDPDGESKYALCKHSCTSDHHVDAHVHFKCSSCKKTICITEEEIPEFTLPKGYVIENVSMLVEGRCLRCSSK